MKLYEYSLLIGHNDIVIANGFLHASNEVVLEARLKKEILPNHKCDWITHKEVFCDECQDDFDVTRYFIHDEPHIKCKFCREKHITAFVADVNKRALNVLRGRG